MLWPYISRVESTRLTTQLGLGGWIVPSQNTSHNRFQEQCKMDPAFERYQYSIDNIVPMLCMWARFFFK